jgi:hypothetical protein
MCFSAPASFTAAAITGLAGAYCVRRVHRRAELPIAAMPLYFSMQQAMEGILWLTLAQPDSTEASAFLTHTFMLFALVFWPVFVPLAALAIEPERWRQLAIKACLVCGIIVSTYFLWSLHMTPRTATIGDHHIVYSADPHLPDIIRVFYPLATCAAPLLSSHRTVQVLGALVFAGSIAAYLAFWNAFTSVWCFFAAAASAVIVFQFHRARQHGRIPFPNAAEQQQR